MLHPTCRVRKDSSMSAGGLVFPWKTTGPEKGAPGGGGQLGPTLDAVLGAVKAQNDRRWWVKDTNGNRVLSAGPSAHLQGSCLKCLLRRWDVDGKYRDESSAQAPYVVCNNCQHSKMGTRAVLKIFTLASEEHAQGSTNRCFRENKHPGETQHKACAGVGRHRPLQCDSVFSTSPKLSLEQ